MHAGTQPERISVQHRIIGVNDLSQAVVRFRQATGPLDLRCLHHRLLIELPSWRHLLLSSRLHRQRLLIVLIVLNLPLLLRFLELRSVCPLQLIGARVRRVLVFAVAVVDHRLRVLSVVLLFCTHGINLGRTQFCGKSLGRNLPSWSICFWNGLG